jgi:hypothetical protein
MSDLGGRHPDTNRTGLIGPSFGEARFLDDGMDILFLAATDTSGVYDYNVYSLSDVTGSEIKQLTHLKGMTVSKASRLIHKKAPHQGR